MAQHNSSEKPLFDNGTCGEYLKSLGVDSKDWQNTTASGKVVDEKYMLDLMEKTLAKQREGEAVNEEAEEPEMEETEEYEEGDFYGSEPDEFEDEENAHRGEELGGGTSDEEGPWNRQPFEEQIDPRWNNMEYFLIDEDVDWNAIEADPKQLFTIGNSKVAADTIIYNLQPARFCPSLANGMCKIVQPKDGQYKIACYAYQDERQYKVALQLRLRQMRFWDTHTAEEIYEKMADFYEVVKGGAMTYAITRAGKSKKANTPARPPRRAGFKTPKLKFIRFNQSGDLKDVDDAKKMDKVAELAEKNLNLVSYTYTARKDIIDQYKFQHVHVQGSGFSAITGINKKVKGGKGEASVGKTFVAFPSLFDKKKKLLERQAGVTYYEDIFNRTTPDGKPNPKYDQYSGSNPSGWYPCPGDCNSCPACKQDQYKNIAVKIHRSFQKMATDWHDVKKTPAGYEVVQKFDPYERDKKTGQPLSWSKKMNKEYEANAELIKKQNKFSQLPEDEQEKVVLDTLEGFYSQFDKDMDNASKAKLKGKIANWEKKAKERGIEYLQLKQQFNMGGK